jgi:uncharacterized protein with HEPN domain
MSKRNDILLLQDIYDAGVKILKYTDGLSFEGFINDEKTIDAVIRNFEIIGEASGRLSEQITARYTEVDWRRMKNFRNLLIHHYFGINYRIVYSVIEDYLPALLSSIKVIIS